MMAAQKKHDWESLDLRLSHVFQPSAPINDERLFRGRRGQVRLIVDAINQPGRHAILFGGRGVGKTSLGKILHSKLHAFEPVPIISPYVTCDSTDDFSSIWRKAFIEITYKLSGGPPPPPSIDEWNDPLTDPSRVWVPFEIRRAIEPFCRDALLYVVFDEFDKLEDPEARQRMAETIKLFSDHVVQATIVIVGVSDDALGLIDDHRSIDRCLAQIPMPRMPRHELEEIVKSGLQQLGMTISSDGLNEITGLSKGLPTYAHLLSLHSGREAIDSKRLEIRLSDVKRAIKVAISHTEESIRKEYDTATFSSRETLHPHVLLACAMARPDEYGRFVPNDVCGPMKIITGREYGTDGFAPHLKQFCSEERGYVLRRTGTDYRWKYQFTNPLLQPFVLMKGLETGKVSEDQLNLNARRGDEDYPLFTSNEP
jgi:Cdc6-like AAA superfamily ATPase